MDQLRRDVRLAFKSMRGAPGLYAVAALSLALGVGANTTIFAAVDAFLYRPLPWPDADRLVQVWNTHEERGWTAMSGSLPDLLDLAAESRTLELAAYRRQEVNLTGGELPERLIALRTSPAFFTVLGARPAIGRAPAAEAAHAGAAPVAVISDGFRHRHFGGAPDVLGRVLLLDGVQHEVIGVMPADFQWQDRATDLWLPLGMTGEESRDARMYMAIARLRPGTTIEQAGAELTQLSAQLAAAYPATNASIGARVVPLHRELFNEMFWTAAMICTVAVGFVLLIACANIANLLLARGATRQREIAVRNALGASRWRLLRQFLTESLALAAVGGALGVLLSVWGVRALIGIMPEFFPLVDRIALNARALVFTLGITVLAGVLAGLAPALHATRVGIGAVLRESGGRGAGLGARGGRTRSALVVVQMALAMVLVISAGLLVKGYSGLRSVPLGFESGSVLTFRLSLPETTYPDSAAMIAVQQALLERVGRLPGVTHAGATTLLPMQGGSGTYYRVEGDAPVEDDQRPVAQWRAVSAGYFDAMRVRVLRGRAFGDDDRLGTAPVALVNEAFVRRHWPDAPGAGVGRRIELTSGGREIVGVVTDTRDFGPGSDPPPMIYLPLSQRAYRNITFAARTTGDASLPAAELRTAVSRVDPGQPIYDLRTMDDFVREQLSADAIMPRLLGVFALIALGLAIMGVYGVMAYSVTQRTPEVGVRMALGAGRLDIVRLVVRQGALLVGVGALLGLLAAVGTSRFLAFFLYGISPFDVATFALATIGLAGAGILASYLPARRAARVDPAISLRYD